MDKKISIVTVCLNAENNIKRTLESVLNLNTTNYEYIIKDGASKDKTNQIVSIYKKKFEKKGIKFIHIIRKDEGIYDAMNQAIDFCNGNWINFMNAGDTFYDNKVIEDVFKNKIGENVGVVFGHTLFCLSNSLNFISSHSVNDIKKNMPIVHQSSFIRKELIKHVKFDCQYKICADYDLFLKLYLKNIQFEQVNVIVSSYKRDGISTYQMDTLYREQYLLKKKYCLCAKTIKKRLIINKLKTILSKINPLISDVVFCYKQMKRMNNAYEHKEINKKKVL